MSKRLRKSNISKSLSMDTGMCGTLLIGKEEVIKYSLTNMNCICVTIDEESLENSDFKYVYSPYNDGRGNLYVAIVGAIKNGLRSKYEIGRIVRQVYNVDKSCFHILHDKIELRKVILERDMYPIIENIDFIAEVYSRNKIMTNSMNIVRKYLNSNVS